MNGLQESTLVAEPGREISREFFILVVKVGLQRKDFQRSKTEGADLFQTLEAELFFYKKVRRESLLHRVSLTSQIHRSRQRTAKPLRCKRFGILTPLPCIAKIGRRHTASSRTDSPWDKT